MKNSGLETSEPESSSVHRRSSGQWTPALFFAAGGLLLVQVLLIGLRRYGASFSELWIVPPAIAALIAALLGVIGLYPHMGDQAPRLARAGRRTAMAAGALLGLAAVWIIGNVLSGGIPQPPPAGFLALIAVFMIAFVLSFVLSAIASLHGNSSRTIGYLLLVPVVSWSIILAAGAATNFSDALKLDFYTNGIVAFAFLATGHILKSRRRNHK